MLKETWSFRKFGFEICRDVVDVNRFAVQNGTAQQPPATINVFIDCLVGRDRPVMCRHSKYIAIERRMTASSASHKRAAFSATASSTGWISVGELAMTPRISLVAVCCSNDSLSSLNSRTFSIAITA